MGPRGALFDTSIKSEYKTHVSLLRDLPCCKFSAGSNMGLVCIGSRCDVRTLAKPVPASWLFRVYSA
jgi:hypothetical protein